MIVAEQTGRYDTVGIDCIAMNVNDVICVGAEPIAVLDYLAVEHADPDVLREIALGLKARRRGRPASRSRAASSPSAARADPRPPVAARLRPHGACFGTVALDAIVTGEAIAPGDALIGLPSSGVHSNGFTLARRALLERRRSALDDAARRAGRRVASPTCCSSRPSSTCARCWSCCAPDVPVRGLAHITGGGVLNLLRLGAASAIEIDDAAARRRRCSS